VKDDLFQELLESIREGGAILRGDARPPRTYSSAEPDVTALREGYGLSQAQFAALLGISVRTLQNWEQGRRTPEGPARVLLRVAAKDPQAILAVVGETTTRRRAAKRSGDSDSTRKVVSKRTKTAASYSTARGAKTKKD
jgi:putative transcriptional regulator